MRAELDFAALHCVRVSVEDFPAASAAARKARDAGRVLLPAFVRDEAACEVYREMLDEMADANGLTNKDACKDCAKMQGTGGKSKKVCG